MRTTADNQPRRAWREGDRPRRTSGQPPSDDDPANRKEFIQELRDHQGTSHIGRKTNSTIDARTTRHPGHAISQRKGKRIEEIFGWRKTVGGLGKTRHRGVAPVGWMFSFALAVYNLVRIRNLRSAPA